jgi:hypothetical protein
MHQRALSDPGALRDAPGGERGVALLDQAPGSGVDQRLAGSGALLCSLGSRMIPGWRCGRVAASAAFGKFIDHLVEMVSSRSSIG